MIVMIAWGSCGRLWLTAVSVVRATDVNINAATNARLVEAHIDMLTSDALPTTVPLCEWVAALEARAVAGSSRFLEHKV